MPTAVAISGSPSRQSKSRRLLAHGVERLARTASGARLSISAILPADDLLGRSRTAAIERALASATGARLLLVARRSTAPPTAACSNFFDLLPQDALAGKVAIPIATGGGPAHLVIDHGLRPLLASVGALVVADRIYGTDAQFGRRPGRGAARAHRRAVAEAQEVMGHGVPESRLGIYYEHPDWFQPLFAELDRRGVPYDALHAGAHQFDPSRRRLAATLSSSTA